MGRPWHRRNDPTLIYAHENTPGTRRDSPFQHYVTEIVLGTSNPHYLRTFRFKYAAMPYIASQPNPGWS